MVIRRHQRRRPTPEPTEPQPRRIPGPRQLPVPEPAPPPVPSVRLPFTEPARPLSGTLRAGLEPFERQRFGDISTFLERYRELTAPPGIPEPVRPLSGILRAGLEPFERRRFELDPSAFGQTQTDLPPAGVGEGFDAALAEARARAADFSDPMNTIEAAAGHVGVALSNNYSPPFIMYEVQSYYGWSDAQMEAAGYVRGLGGWTLDVGEGDLPTTAGDTGDGGRAEGASWSFPALGGSRNSFAGSSLINWRI